MSNEFLEHDTTKELELLERLSDGLNPEDKAVIEEICFDLQNPLVKFSIDEAKFQVSEILDENEVATPEIISEIAERLYDSGLLGEGENDEEITEHYFAERKRKTTETKEENSMAMFENAIYTHDEAMQIVELFEDVLDAANIVVPSPEDDEKDRDNDACLYGSVYSDLLDDVESQLKNILQRHKPDTKIVTDVFSGRV